MYPSKAAFKLKMIQNIIFLLLDKEKHSHNKANLANPFRLSLGEIPLPNLIIMIKLSDHVRALLT